MTKQECEELALTLNICSPTDANYSCLLIILYGCSNNTVSVGRIKRGLRLPYSVVNECLYNLWRGGFIWGYWWFFEDTPPTVIEITLATLCGGGKIRRYKATKINEKQTKTNPNRPL